MILQVDISSLRTVISSAEHCDVYLVSTYQMLIDEDCFEVTPHINADQTLALYFLKNILFLQIIGY